MKQEYYFPNSEHIDCWFGGSDPVCIDRQEAERLATAWETEEKAAADILNQLHEATTEEIAEYGVYDSDET